MTISVPDARESASLYSWLSRDTDVARGSVVAVRKLGPTGAMNAFDVIDIVLTQAIAISNLLLAFSAWRRTRPVAPPVTFVINGVPLVAEDGSPHNMAAIEQAMRAGVADAAESHESS